MNEHFDIAIVGGGMAGSCLALLLAQKTPQLRIVLIEALPLQVNQASSLPSYDDRSSALSLGSCRILQTLNLWGDLLPHLSAITQVHVSDRGHPAGTLLDAAQMASLGGDLGYVIENRQLGQILIRHLAKLPNVLLIGQTQVDKISLNAESVILHINQPSQKLLNVKLAVIADGAESSLREQLGIAVDRKPYKQAAVITNVTTSSFHHHVAYERFTDTGPMALLPLQDYQREHRCALVWTVNENYIDVVKNMDDSTFLQNIQQRFGNRLGFFVKAGKRIVYPLVLHKANEQVRSRIVLMGNAAHAMHPVAGQGFNLSLRDCDALADVLKNALANNEDIGHISVLQRYINIQKNDQDKTINTSHLLTLLFSTAETPAAFARNTGLFGLNFLPGIKNWFARQAMGLGDR